MIATNDDRGGEFTVAHHLIEREAKLVALAQTMGLPIRFIGIGEGAGDLGTFNAADYADALLKGDSGNSNGKQQQQ